MTNTIPQEVWDKLSKIGPNAECTNFRFILKELVKYYKSYPLNL